MAADDSYRFSVGAGDVDPEERKQVLAVLSKLTAAVSGEQWIIGMSAINSLTLQLLMQQPDPEHQLILTIEGLCTGLKAMQALIQANQAAVAGSDKVS